MPHTRRWCPHAACSHYSPPLILRCCKQAALHPNSEKTILTRRHSTPASLISPQPEEPSLTAFSLRLPTERRERAERGGREREREREEIERGRKRGETAKERERESKKERKRRSLKKLLREREWERGERKRFKVGERGRDSKKQKEKEFKKER